MTVPSRYFCHYYFEKAYFLFVTSSICINLPLEHSSHSVSSFALSVYMCMTEKSWCIYVKAINNMCHLSHNDFFPCAHLYTNAAKLGLLYKCTYSGFVRIDWHRLKDVCLIEWPDNLWKIQHVQWLCRDSLSKGCWGFQSWITSHHESQSECREPYCSSTIYNLIPSYQWMKAERDTDR